MKITEQQKATIRTVCALVSVMIQIVLGIVVIYFDSHTTRPQVIRLRENRLLRPYYPLRP